MKTFQNKKIWQKIVIILLVILLFKFVINIPKVHAAEDGVLLEPITNLFANLGDGIMEIAQRTFLDMDSSGAWIEDNNITWPKVLTIVIGLAVATIAVAATIVTGGWSLVVVASLVGAVVKIGVSTAIAYFAVSTIHFGNKGFYLPEYELTLESILKNQVLAFDVNFFNPKQPELKNIETYTSINIGENHTDSKGNKATSMNETQYNEFLNKYNIPGDPLANYSNYDSYESGDYSIYIRKNTPFSGGSDEQSLRMRKYTWNDGDKEYSAYFGKDTFAASTYYVSNFKTPQKNETYDYSPAFILQPAISSWYLALRNIALVALLSILVYIGIRITLTSVAGDKAKYKQMLVDWVVALALVFLMHYIMSFAVNINQFIIEGISNITLQGYGSEEDVVGDGERKVGNVETDNFVTKAADYCKNPDVQNVEAAQKFEAAGVQFFILDEPSQVKKAYKVLVDDGNGDASDNKGAKSPFYNRFNEDQTVMVWPANDFMVQARILGQDIGENEQQTKVARAGYNIVYVVLVIYTIMFCFTYLRRVIYMAFLTLIAPLVAITYPIDKISDGKAQAFDMWIKEYIFNLLMQPMHLILYTILVSMAMKFAANNIFYAVIAIGFLVPAEKILRRFFRFERAQTPGMFEGAAGAALLMQGINRLTHRSSNKSKLGSGGSEKDDEENSKISTYKGGEDPYKELGEKEDETDKTVSKGSEGKDSEKDYTVQTGGNFGGADFSAGTTTTSSPSDGKNIKDNNKGASDQGNDKEKENGKGKRQWKRHPGRMIRRGLISHGEGIRRRYKANKKLKGGLARRALRTSAGIATAGTMAAAGGIIGIATGDISKAAQYMGAGALGGYKLGQAGVNKTADKLKEQYQEPLKEAKIGYYGEEEYQKREYEKWKKREFEQNASNIMKLQDRYNLSYKEAKELSTGKLAELTKTKSIDSFDKALATYASTTEGGGSLSKEEALIVANISNTKINGKGADSLKRDERQQLTSDVIDRIRKNNKNISEADATKLATRFVEGTNIYAKNLK